MEDAEKFPLYIQFTQCLLHITERLSVVGIDWASLRNLSMLLAQYMWDVAIPPTHCFTAVHSRHNGWYSPRQEIIDPTPQQDRHADDQNSVTYTFSTHTHVQLNCWCLCKGEFTVKRLSYSQWSEPQCHVLRNTRWFKYDRDWFVCKQAALHSSCATLKEWSHNLHPPSCSG